MSGRRAFNGARRLPSIVSSMDRNLRGKTGQPRRPRHPPKISPATYWRRRILVLAVGIGLLAAISWAANGLLVARSTAVQVVRSAGTKSAGFAPGNVSADRMSPMPSASPSSSPAPSRHRDIAQPQSSGQALPCAAGAVTLRLSSPQYWYQAGKTPRFTVRAISGQRRPCRFNMSPRFVSVVVTAAGQRIWSSADCASGSRSDMIVLTRGVPAVLRLSWDRRTSSPGCSGIRPAVRPGEYKIVATAGHLRSATANLVLGAKGASGP
jgi:hypothetical protein